MAINTTLESASTTAASNGPSGSDQRTLADDGLRQYLAFIKSLKTLAVLASATTVTPPSTANAFSVTGTTAITTIASTNSWDGRDILFIFAGILTLTNGANLIIPGSANITTAVGDGAWLVQVASGQWRVVGYSRADGSIPFPQTNLTLTGNLSVQGNTTLGNASGDTLTIHPNTITWQNDPTHSANHTFSGNTTFTGNATVNGNTTLGNANTDTVTTNGAVTCNAPSSGATANLFGSAETLRLIGDAPNIGGWNAANSTRTGLIQFNATIPEVVIGVDTGGMAFATNGSRRLSITSDGRVFGGALHNNAGAVTGTTNQFLCSGTYTATITDSTNVSGHSVGASQWIRVGNVVTVSGSSSITTSGAGVSLFRISLPIASNLASIGQLAGAGGSNAGGASSSVLTVYEEISTDQAETSHISLGAGTRQFYWTFTYVVV